MPQPYKHPGSGRSTGAKPNRPGSAKPAARKNSGLGFLIALGVGLIVVLIAWFALGRGNSTTAGTTDQPADVPAEQSAEQSAAAAPAPKPVAPKPVAPPKPAVPEKTEAQRLFDKLESLQKETEKLGVDAYGPKGLEAITNTWRTRSAPVAKADFESVPYSFVGVIQLAGQSPAQQLTTIWLRNHPWEAIAPQIGASLEEQTASLFAATLTRPDGKKRVVFADVRTPLNANSTAFSCEWRAIACEPPTAQEGFKALKSTEWAQLFEFRNDLFISRAARAAKDGQPVLSEAIVVILQGDREPKRYHLKVDNDDVVTFKQAK